MSSPVEGVAKTLDMFADSKIAHLLRVFVLLDTLSSRSSLRRFSQLYALQQSHGYQST